MTRSFLCVLLVAACGDPGGDGNEGEVITTVTLAFTPTGGGTTVTAAFDDPDGDGGDPPTIDPVNLAAAPYTLAVRFENRLEDPPEEITDEVRDEGDEHQLFFTGSAIEGPAATNPAAPLVHAYADTDDAGLPVGLENTITARTGAGTLTVTLKHLPPLDGNALKTSDLAAMVKAAGINSIGGDTDVSVSFSVQVP
ncbi:MAG TPA: hypothetical protein VIU61_28430 [Kofleriaceae bacterium]